MSWAVEDMPLNEVGHMDMNSIDFEDEVMDALSLFFSTDEDPIEGCLGLKSLVWVVFIVI